MVLRTKDNMETKTTGLQNTRFTGAAPLLAGMLLANRLPARKADEAHGAPESNLLKRSITSW